MSDIKTRVRVYENDTGTLFDFGDLDSMFKDFFQSTSHRSTTVGYTMTRTPDNGACLISIDLPGVKKEDVDISIGDRRITIEATRRGHKASTTQHTFTLSDDHDGAATEASLSDGVLEVKIPYRKKTPTPKTKVSVK